MRPPARRRSGGRDERAAALWLPTSHSGSPPVSPYPGVLGDTGRWDWDRTRCWGRRGASRGYAFSSTRMIGCFSRTVARTSSRRAVFLSKAIRLSCSRSDSGMSMLTREIFLRGADGVVPQLLPPAGLPSRGAGVSDWRWFGSWVDLDSGSLGIESSAKTAVARLPTTTLE